MVITRVAPLSVAKVAGILYALIGFLIGAVMSLASLAGAFGAGTDEMAFVGALFGVGAIILAPILYGCFGFVMTFLMALLYNAISGVVGGVEIDVR
jgi:hypothetical protein